MNEPAAAERLCVQLPTRYTEAWPEFPATTFAVPVPLHGRELTDLFGTFPNDSLEFFRNVPAETRLSQGERARLLKLALRLLLRTPWFWDAFWCNFFNMLRYLTRNAASEGRRTGQDNVRIFTLQVATNGDTTYLNQLPQHPDFPVTLGYNLKHYFQVLFGARLEQTLQLFDLHEALVPTSQPVVAPNGFPHPLDANTLWWLALAPKRLLVIHGPPVLPPPHEVVTQWASIAQAFAGHYPAGWSPAGQDTHR